MRCKLGVAVGLGFCLLASPAAAQPTDLFISEYAEGALNDKALEIFNGTGGTVDLSAYSVLLYLNGSSTPSSTITLTSSILSGDVYVLRNTSATNSDIIAASDQSASLGFNGDDAVVLMHEASVLDVIGQIGVDPGSAWGSAPTSTADNDLQRLPAIEAGDTNGVDAFDPGPEWDGFAITSEYPNLGEHSIGEPPPDGDRDGVVDASDLCPATAGSPPEGCVEQSRTLTLKKVKRGKRFKATLASAAATCISNQEVTLFKQRAAGDTELGSAFSLSTGKVTFTNKAKRGKYYATVERTTLPPDTCVTAESPLVKIR
jgi:hypothetical protein